MNRRLLVTGIAAVTTVAIGFAFLQKQRVGDRNASHSTQLLPDASVLSGKEPSVSFGGRPVDISSSKDGRWLAVKDDQGVRICTPSMKLVGEWKSTDGTSPCGISFAPDGGLWVTTSNRYLVLLSVSNEGLAKEGKKIDLGDSMPCGFALDPSGSRAYVALSTSNQLVEVDLSTGKVLRKLDVGVAPFDVCLDPDGGRIFVSEQGGLKAETGVRSAPSAGTEVSVDKRGILTAGAMACIDLTAWKVTRQVSTPTLPSSVVYSKKTGYAYVACANSNIVVAFNPATQSVVTSELPSQHPLELMPTGLALAENVLYVSMAGNNTVQRFELDATGSLTRGTVAKTDWFPVALASSGNKVFAACTRGLGSRTKKEAAKGGLNSYDYSGTVVQCTQFAEPSPDSPKWAEVKLPPIKHVVYVIKENRTYDQVYGDVSGADGDPNLCQFGQKITPNQHALAREWVTLDNYYCSGVLSADGHSWATEGNSTPYLERSFGGFKRSYTFGDDPLTYSSTGFLWDAFLDNGLTFRNYGEFDYAAPGVKVSDAQFYRDSLQHKRLAIDHNIGVKRVRDHSYIPFPGWNMSISDQYRMDRFEEDFQALAAQGVMANLTTIYLPQDHTGGPASPRAHVADNDLAVGRMIDILSHSPFWKDTVVFVTEDDPQAGLDHIDGHRSGCLVIGPYVKRRQISSQFHTQASVLHTICDLFGLPPLNYKTAIAPSFREVWRRKPDVTAFTALKTNVPLDEGAPTAAEYRDLVAGIDLRKQEVQTPRDMDRLNRAVWFAQKGSARYPSEWAGAHGRGLAQKGLLRTESIDDED